MDAAGRDAQRLLVALWRAAKRLRSMAYELFLEHQPDLTWREFALYGATPGMQALGVTLGLGDGREMFCTLTVRMSPEAFSAEADIAVDAPDDEENGGYHCPFEIPETHVDSLDACLRLIEDQVDRLTASCPRLLRELRSVPSRG
ncbi:hypothetical protein [Streptomyces curacoi]|uniref:Uncharacterized protein n=1 Tax=Streptomyces curacoi TaxID=146536 RepID=A0A117NYQ9_9ACTN|nr:hypothetical protein [Streptomyces curacoi]KUM69867.1 hypothetical protein AQI70_29945 [Streptomyces curacoi]